MLYNIFYTIENYNYNNNQYSVLNKWIIIKLASIRSSLSAGWIIAIIIKRTQKILMLDYNYYY